MQVVTVSGSEKIPGDISIWDLLQVLRERRVFFAAVVGVCTAIAAIAAIVMTPVYRAEVLLFPSDQETVSGFPLGGQLGGIAALAGLRPMNNRQAELAVATLESREFIGSFIQQHNLVSTLLPPPSGLRRMLALGKSPRPPTIDDAIKVFRKRIQRVEVEADTGIVKLTIEFHDRNKVAEWANEIVAQINEQMRRRTIAQARSRLDFLYGELNKTSIVGIQQAIFNLIETETKNIMIANTEKEFAFRAVETVRPPPEKDFVRPQRLVMVLAGFVAGMLVSLVLSVFFAAAGVRAGARRGA